MLDVLSIAHRLSPVRADSIGGAEQVLSALDRALVSAGHRSTVLACEGSSVIGTLREVPIGAGPWTAESRARAAQRFTEQLEQLLGERRFDLIHFHGLDAGSYPLEDPWLRDVPKLVTLHLPLDWYPRGLLTRGGNLVFNTVSDWQRDQVSGEVNVIATVPNGVDLSSLYPEPEPSGGYVACLGRICPEKGFDLALRAARSAGVPLRLAGQTFAYPDHQRHFEEEIMPCLDDERRFLGPLTGEAKRRFLANARALVVPSRVAETCSLVTLEALACGTPVIASGAGATSAWIEPGVTGWVASDERAIAQALGRLGGLSRAACRRRAEQLDARKMTQRYLALYEMLATGARRTRWRVAG